MDETNDSDIYADLPKFRYFDSIDKLQATNKSLSQEIIQLNETLAKVTKEKDEYQTKCANLANNISSLLKTAQSEIQRKDKLIKELRDQIADSLKYTQNRKRRLTDEDFSHVKRINTSTRLITERTAKLDEAKFSKHLDESLKRNKNIVSEKRDFPLYNDKKIISASKYDGTNNFKNRNGEINTVPNAALPPGGCKTLYSQRMFKKLNMGQPESNKSPEVVQMECREKKNLEEETNINGKGSLKAGNIRVFENNASKQSVNLDKSSVCTSPDIENAEITRAPLITNRNNLVNNNVDNGNKSQTDTNVLDIEGNVKDYNEIKKATDVSDNNGLQSTLLHKSNINIEQRSKSLKAITSIESSSVENNVANKKEMEKRNQKSENDLFCKTLPTKQQISPTELKNSELSINDTKNDTPKFIRPTCSSVIKKQTKKIILPVSDGWIGLIKTVDRKENDLSRTVEISSKCLINKTETNTFNDNASKQIVLDSPELDSNKTRANNVLEDLFGSPLKWAETSNETIPLLELNSPAVYEDSCSAQIENAKFHLKPIKPAVEKPVSVRIPNSSETNTIGCKTVKQNENPNKQHSAHKGTVTNLNQSVRAFEDVGINKQKMKSIFSPLKTDSCKSGLIIPASPDLVDLSLNIPFKSKYEDSVLGQFDDTTQFVSALTKVESKISPLNTPVKSVSKPVTVNTTLSSKTENKTFSQVCAQKLESNQLINTSNSMTSKRNFNEKPINILYPRKTPRTVIYNSNKEENSSKKKSTAISDTPTKCNRFAINDAFISQQEEKVKRICKNNFNDPIAITISSKNKVKGKESSINQTPQGKGTLSPRKSKTSPDSWKKYRNVLHGSLLVQKELSDFLQDLDLPNGGSSKPLINQNKNDNSSCKLLDNGRDQMTVLSSTVRREQKIECTGTVTLQNVENEIKKDDLKQTFNDTIHSVLDKRKANDLEENIDTTNNIKELHLTNKLSTPNTDINQSDYKKRSNENNFVNNNVDVSTVKENPVKKIIPKECSSPEVPVYNKTGANQNFNNIRSCDKTRVQNFKPSSQFKRTNKQVLQQKSQECEKIVPLHESFTENVSKEIGSSNRRTPDKRKSNEDKAESKSINGNINQDQQNRLINNTRNSPNVIIRSSKKPEFVSTTLSGDDFVSNSVVKSPEVHSRNYNKNGELREWVLKPITFESDPSCSKKLITDNRKEVPQYIKHSNNIATSNCVTRKSVNFEIPLKNTSKVVSRFSPDKKVVLARRPLNFGVKVTLD